MIDAKKALEAIKTQIPLDYDQWGSRILVILACGAWNARYTLHKRMGYKQLLEIYADRIACRPAVLQGAIRKALEVSDFPFSPAETMEKMMEVISREN